MDRRAVLGSSSTSPSLPSNQHREEILGPACNTGIIVDIDSFVVAMALG
jgi:hypothetical protein